MGFGSGGLIDGLLGLIFFLIAVIAWLLIFIGVYAFLDFGGKDYALLFSALIPATYLVWLKVKGSV